MLHAIPGIPAHAGGPSRSVPGLCRALSEVGLETWLLSFYTEDVLEDPRNVNFITGPGFRYSSALRTSQEALKSVNPHIVHVHGLWTPANHAMIVQARMRRIPVVISIRGMLDPWALKQKRGKKLLAMLLYQWRDIRTASLLHATARQEYENIRKQRFRQPVAVIPNGVEVPADLALARHGTAQPADRLRTALFLARLHPGKGLLDLAEAWARVRPQGWRMRVVGPDNHGHQAEVTARLRALGLEQEWVFEGSVDDTGKWQYYQQADLFILPSHSENFGISIAEALYAGVPVITTRGTPWSELQGNSERSKVPECGRSKVFETSGTERVMAGIHSYGSCDLCARAAGNPVNTTPKLSNFRTSRCGWWTDIGAQPLANALREATKLTDAERCTMGHEGRSLIESKYRWNAIAGQMKEAYSWLLNSKSPSPAFLRARN